MDDKRQYCLYDLIDKIRRRPGMWIGDPTPIALRQFLVGYQCAMDDAGIEDVAYPEFHGFHDWIAKRFGYYESTAGWANMISAVVMGYDPATINWNKFFVETLSSEQGKYAVNYCFELMDEYRQSVKKSEG